MISVTVNYQSVYSRRQSRKTALLKVPGDLAGALDEGSMTALNLLDLSATFNVIHHPIILKRLEFSFGIKQKDFNLGTVVPRELNK